MEVVLPFVVVYFEHSLHHMKPSHTLLLIHRGSLWFESHHFL